ncbi:hypothetical protein P5673_008162 [Acropora cervicornis]|uniref:Uncharacterized protein n=1 Tax=Acropora cervicornis TaxID=6130 RepID=A0AAD9VAN5_ACRCE|nr:hypothetical protein P5673_008162 [Acropora cervicornis]
MPLSKFQATTLLGVAVFLVGVACFVAAALHRVFPARAEQNLKAINCTITSGDMEMKVKCSHNKHGDTSYPCLRVYVLCGNETKRSGLFEDERPRLLRRDFYSIHEKCSFQPDECKDNTEVRPNLAIGSTLQCFFNPEDTHQIVRIKASTESYNELLVSQVVWPLAIMMLGIVIIAAASCYYFSRNVNRYEELPGKSSATLLLTI